MQQALVTAPQSNAVVNASVVQRMPTANAYLTATNRLAMLATQRSAIVAEEREVMKAYQNDGGSKPVLRVVRMIAKLDPDDRPAFLAELDALLTFSKFW